MKAQEKKKVQLRRRRLHVRKKLRGTAERPRLVIQRSLGHIYAQIVDDTEGKTIAAVATTQAKVAEGLKATANIDAAKAVGKGIAEAAVARGIKTVCFDRGGRKYHGRVKALADAAREAGLSF